MMDFVITNDGFCIKMMDLVISNDAAAGSGGAQSRMFLNDAFNDNFIPNMMGFMLIK